MFDTFIAPPSASRPTTLVASTPQPTHQPSRANHWVDAAATESWQAAILGYLRERRTEAVKLWEVVNEVVSKSGQPTRSSTRFATRQVLQAVKQLLHERRILRFRRKHLAILDIELDTISLEHFFALPNRTATGRLAADSTPASKCHLIPSKRS
jgi:hypothetical protein